MVYSESGSIRRWEMEWLATKLKSHCLNVDTLVMTDRSAMSLPRLAAGEARTNHQSTLETVEIIQLVRSTGWGLQISARVPIYPCLLQVAVRPECVHPESYND